MVPDKFNMVDMGGVDLILMQGEEVSGLYNRLVESIAQCRYQCLYNWLFNGVVIPPTYVEMEVGSDEEVKINEGVVVTSDDVIHIYSIEPPAPEPVISPLLAEENGVYEVPTGVDGFNPVAVNVPTEEGVKLKVGPVFEQVFEVPVSSEYGTMINGGATQFITPVKDDGTEAKVDLSLPFEICCTFMLTNAPSASTGRNVFGAIGYYWECPAIAAYDGKFTYFFTTTSGTWTHNAITITPSGYSTPLNTWIVAKIIYDGTKYVFSIDDGTVQASQELTGVTTYYNSNYRFCFGSQANSTTYAIAQTGAKIKIKGTYLKQNNIIIWGKEH